MLYGQFIGLLFFHPEVWYKLGSLVICLLAFLEILLREAPVREEMYPSLLTLDPILSSPSFSQANKLAEKRKAHDDAVRSEKKAKRTRPV